MHISQLLFSDDLNVVNGGKIFPTLRDDELDHDVAGWLLDTHWFALSWTSIGWDLSWLSDRLKPVSICCLTTFNGNFLDARRNKSDLVNNLGLLELNGQFLWVHSRRQPVWVIISKRRKIVRSNLVISAFELTVKLRQGQISHRS